MTKVKLSVGCSGLRVALCLYGASCVVSARDAYSPADIEIPEEDVEAYQLMLQEERSRLG